MLMPLWDSSVSKKKLKLKIPSFYLEAHKRIENTAHYSKSKHDLLQFTSIRLFKKNGSDANFDFIN